MIILTVCRNAFSKFAPAVLKILSFELKVIHDSQGFLVIPLNEDYAEAHQVIHNNYSKQTRKLKSILLVGFNFMTTSETEI